MSTSQPGVGPVRTRGSGSGLHGATDDPPRDRRRRPAAALVAALAALALTATTVPAAAHDRPDVGGPPDTHVVAWDVIGVEALKSRGLPVDPTDGHLVLAYVAVAVYDAVMAVTDEYEPFAVDVDAPDGTSAEAAVVSSAHRVLVHYLPGQQEALDDHYQASLAGLGTGEGVLAGVAVGEEVAASLIAMRSGDGFRGPVDPYPAPNPPVPGVWVPTAPTPPLGLHLVGMQPFALRSADQFRPGGPPSLHSGRYAREYAEVQRLGRALPNTERTPEQTAAALFWGEPPVQQARGSFQKFVTDRRLDIGDAARFMAMMSVTYADGLIACFDAKYADPFWRPVTAIRAGHTDGNDRTAGDPTWTPLVGTPNHPEYPSAHSCISPAAGTVIARFLGTDDIDFTVPSTVEGRPSRHFASPDQLAEEVANARVWGGVHFRSAVEDGTKIAERTARYVLNDHFDE